jgi:pimeloyl-ACP methyl ester carboxylesterase
MLNVILALTIAMPWLQFVPPPALPVPQRSGLAPVNGIHLWYAEFGTGKPVIFLHGGLANANYWGHQVRALESHYRVIVLDSRGHGRSTRTNTPLSYTLMAADVLALMDYLQVRNAALVGWSDGAIVGLEIVLRHPERVTKLFAFGANSNPGALILTPHPSDRAFFEEAMRQYRALSPTPQGFKSLLMDDEKMSSREPHFTALQLRTIKVPTWIVAGDHDQSIERSDTDFMAAQIPGAYELILPGVGHDAPLQDPAFFSAALLHFMGY